MTAHTHDRSRAIRTRRGRRPRCGASRSDVLVAVATGAVALAVLLPGLAAARGGSRTKASMNNLMTLGTAHVVYAADWNGRQFTNSEDDLAVYGDDQTTAFPGFHDATGEWPAPLVLGWGTVTEGGTPVLFRYSTSFNEANRTFSQPIVLDGPLDMIEGIGWFRVPNAKPFHDYLGGRFHDPVFYAPADVVAYELTEPAFDEPDEYVRLRNGSPLGDVPMWSSYCLSPAALFDPQVFRPEPDGGYQDPYSIDTGFTAPGLWQAQYPDLKTFMLEHHWNTNAPADRCIPDYPTPTFWRCEPHFFTHGLLSEPVTLFYDLHVRLLPNTEVLAADGAVMKATGFGLWSRDTPFGTNGYFGQYAVDVPPLGHHVLTTSGILGRDTVAAPPGGAAAP